MIADHNASIRLALRMFLQVQNNYNVVAEVSRIGELLRDAPVTLPDLIIMSWSLPDIQCYSLSGYKNKQERPSINQVKAIIIHTLHNIPSKPEIIVIADCPGDLLPVLYSQADEFLYQGEMPGKLLSLIESIQNKRQRISPELRYRE